MLRNAIPPLLVAALAVGGCSVNPATGTRQLALIGEDQEVAIGREADPEIIASMGLVEDDELQAYVDRVGRSLAAVSERPDLPWTFRVVDDPVVNAFALPGGYIYITRGILAHLDSEAELASVLGHEIGHVTARHSVNQMSKQQLMGLGLGIGMVLAPEMQSLGNLAQTGLGLLFLKYSRDDERQADELGLRYMERREYELTEAAPVFRMLEAVSQAESGGQRVPGWLSTHPDPGARADRLDRLASATGASDGRVGEQELLDAIDGVVYGVDPRQGYFDGSLLVHPGLAFQIRFPGGWQTANQRSRVLGVSPEQDALLELTLAPEDTPEAAAKSFLGQEGLTVTRTWRKSVHGARAVWGSFEVPNTETPLAGRVAFVAHGGSAYRLLGYGRDNTWLKYLSAMERWAESFQELTDPNLLGIQPPRLEIVRLPQEMPFEELVDRYPSSVPKREVALLNRLSPGVRLPAGSAFKTVVGGVGAPEEDR